MIVLILTAILIASLTPTLALNTIDIGLGLGRSDRYIIVINNTKLVPIIKYLVSRLGRVKAFYDDLGIAIVEGKDLDRILSRFRGVLVAKDRMVKFILPPKVMSVVTSSLSVSDPLYRYQWNLRIINATPNKAWSITTGSPVVKVAVLDTGVYWLHPDILPNYDFEYSRSFVDVPSSKVGDDDLTPMDYFGHGTWCAGTIAAVINGYGVVGVAPRVKIVNVKVINADGMGYWSWLVEGIIYSADIGAKVISMSLGGYLNLSNKDDRVIYLALLKAVLYARAKGSLLVAAIGNNALDLTKLLAIGIVEVPAEIPGVIAVSAITDRYELAPYSNYGFGIVDLAAPGGYWYGYPNPGWWYHLCISCWSPKSWLYPNRYFMWMAGTSAACPHVSGVAALIFSIDPRARPSTIEFIMKETAIDLGVRGYDSYYGYGLIDAYKALQLAIKVLRIPLLSKSSLSIPVVK